MNTRKIVAPVMTALVGGGDSAAKEALLLSQFASKVYVLARGDKLRGEPINNQRVAQNPKIEVFTKVNVKQIVGDKIVKALVLDRPVKDNTTLNLDAVFIAILMSMKMNLSVQFKKEIN